MKAPIYIYTLKNIKNIKLTIFSILLNIFLVLLEEKRNFSNKPNNKN